MASIAVLADGGDHVAGNQARGRGRAAGVTDRISAPTGRPGAAAVAGIDHLRLDAERREPACCRLPPVAATTRFAAAVIESATTPGAALPGVDHDADDVAVAVEQRRRRPGADRARRPR